MLSAIRGLIEGRTARGSARVRRRTSKLSFEALEGRRVLASNSTLPLIMGTVYQDINNNGEINPGEAVAGAIVRLFLDDGDGLFEPGGDDTQVGADVLTEADNGATGADETGTYCFGGLDPQASYFVQQPSQTVGGETLGSLVSVQLTPGVPNLLIDSFLTTQSTTAAPPAPSQDDSALGFGNEAEVIGQERDLAVNLISGSSEVQLRVNPFGLQEVLLFDSAAGSQGTRRITWDGVDNAGDVLGFGLNGRDLTQGGENTGIVFMMGVDANGANARMRFYNTDALTFSEAIVPIPVTGGAADEFVFIPFTDFVGSVNPNDVDAIELTLDTGNFSVDGQIDFVGAIGPVVQNFENEVVIDLELTKTVDRTQVNNGEQVTWTLSLTNNSTNATSAATNVDVVDVLPSGLSIQSATPSDGTFANGVWTLANPLARGATATLNLVTTVDSSVAGGTQLINTAQVRAADQTDIDSAVNNDDGDQSEDDEDQATITVNNLVDLELQKTVNTSVADNGDTVNFTLSVTNNATNANTSATGVTISDPLPAGLTLVTATPSTGSFSSGVWTLPGSLAPGATETLAIAATVNGGVTGGTIIENVAQVTSVAETDVDSAANNDDGDQSEDDEAMAMITINPIIDLELSKAVSDATPSAGSNVTWTISVTNNAANANANATGVQIRDVLPSGLTLVSATPSDGSFSSGIWTLASALAPGATETLTLVTTVNSSNAGGAQIINVSQVIAANEQDADSAPDNDDGDQSQDDESMAMLTVASVIDLELTKTVSTSTANAGDQVTWTLTLINNLANANAPATGVQITDAIPAGLTFVSASPSGNGSFSGDIWTLNDSLVPGGIATLAIVTTVNNTLSGGAVVTNTAQVSAANESDIDSQVGNDDGNQSEDDEDRASLTINSVIDLELEKTADRNTVPTGENVTWTITVRNDNTRANTAATGVTVSDPLPNGVSFVSSSTSNGSYNDASGVWSLANSLTPGQSASLSIVTSVNEAAAGTDLRNVAQVSAHNEVDVDSEPANDDGDQSQDDEDVAEVRVDPIRPLSKRDFLASS